MDISVFGLGYVGAVSLACLAKEGHNVTGVDIDSTKLALIKAGKSPVIETGMPELVQEVVASGRIKLTESTQEAISQTQLSFVCVGTPSQPNGNQDQTAVLRLTEQLGEALKSKKDHHIIVFRSTLLPGTVINTLIPLLEKFSGKTNGVDFDVCFQPEFLREGSSIKDYYKPPFTIIGLSSKQPQAVFEQLFSNLPAEIIYTDIATAETMKYFCNIFHALKITFANEVARLCESIKVDPHAVMELICKDKQLNISSAYMKPGFSFGGSCLPKDLRAINYIAKQNDVDIPMLKAVLPSNRVHLDCALHKITQSGLKKIGFIGLSFKTGTDDLRESPLVDLAEKLIGKGYTLKIYDPEVNISKLIGANKHFIETSIPHIGSLMTTDYDNLLSTSEIIVVGISDSDLVTTLIKSSRKEQIILDLVNIKERDKLSASYMGICWK
ncbi:nucleotide sugar dehydrogenase [Nitrosomonas sp.]|uniref:nucleotide sugar dehydrogenase n=1 Tax=Nitrosomonas sp. TaxID=42353 RepID=UPI001D1F668B|nr:nucleotide sugar dehydrogenase [Nitrosomonas sp.]MCB1948991.1 UDP-glucose/GDP-mannose dehydrogenase family protein [Nitrosomonas sp.]